MVNVFKQLKQDGVKGLARTMTQHRTADRSLKHLEELLCSGVSRRVCDPRRIRTRRAARCSTNLLRLAMSEAHVLVRT